MKMKLVYSCRLIPANDRQREKKTYWILTILHPIENVIGNERKNNTKHSLIRIVPYRKVVSSINFIWKRAQCKCDYFNYRIVAPNAPSTIYHTITINLIQFCSVPFCSVSLANTALLKCKWMFSFGMEAILSNSCYSSNIWRRMALKEIFQLAIRLTTDSIEENHIKCITSNGYTE